MTTATFTDEDYEKARLVLVKRYPMLEGSDSLDEMVQQAAIKVWTARCRDGKVHGRLFRLVCRRAAAEVVGDVYRRARLETCAAVMGSFPGPVETAELREFMDGLSCEERAIIEALLRCGDRRVMMDVAEMVGVNHQRVKHVMWLLRRRLRKAATGKP